MDELLKELGITESPVKSSNNTYVIDIADSDEFGKIYSKLDKSKHVDEIASSSQMTYESASIQFENDELLLTLMADFEEDNYKLTIKEL